MGQRRMQISASTGSIFGANQQSNDAKKKALDILRSKIDFEAANFVDTEGIRRVRNKALKKSSHKRRKKRQPAMKEKTDCLFRGRAPPLRVTSMVSGGLPGLGKRRK